MGKTKLKVQTSWDDGHSLDKKLASMLKDHNLSGVFYLPTRCAMFTEIDSLQADGFEIGAHSMTHPQDMKLLTTEDIDWEIGSNKKLLELEMLGEKVTKFCYPRGRYDDRAIEVLKKYHFKSARTTKVFSIKPPEDPFRTDTTIHVYPRAEYLGEPWDVVAMDWALKASQEAGIFHLWGHSWEIDRLEQWNNLEMFFKWLNENFDVC